MEIDDGIDLALRRGVWFNSNYQKIQLIIIKSTFRKPGGMERVILESSTNDKMCSSIWEIRIKHHKALLFSLCKNGPKVESMTPRVSKTIVELEIPKWRWDCSSWVSQAFHSINTIFDDTDICCRRCKLIYRFELLTIGVSPHWSVLNGYNVVRTGKTYAIRFVIPFGKISSVVSYFKKTIDWTGFSLFYNLIIP